MHTDRCGNTRNQKCCAKGSGKEVKIQKFMYRDITIIIIITPTEKLQQIGQI
jgi:hypothetical protein